MAKTHPLLVKDLNLDLRNFRTIPQEDELSALHTMISINPDRFWALMDSLLDTGYLPTENIIVLEDAEGIFHVKEGNRRIGALKLAFKYLSSVGLSMPKEIDKKLKNLTAEWKKINKEVPCSIYEEKEESLVDKIVTLAHGKGEKAGRDNWTSVARARHNRDKNGVTETGLDLLEKYLEKGKNLTKAERELWSGVYSLTVLDEVVGKIALRLGFTSSRDLTDQYPSKYWQEIEEVLKDIGNDRIKFETIRDKVNDFATPYGIPALPKQVVKGSKKTPTVQVAGLPPVKGVKATALNDRRNVMSVLKGFSPRGKGRGKVVNLLDEARQLKIDKTPLAFCFVLRALFEVSAKVYSTDANISFTKNNGKDKTLVELLGSIVTHMTLGKSNTDPLCRELHGSMTELGKSSGLLSVTSMNQLIHSSNFIVDETHICTVFANIFPLLREMNS